MYKMKDLIRKIVAFALCFVMVLGNVGGVAYGADDEVHFWISNAQVNAESELVAGYEEVELNRNGGLVTTYFPAYESTSFAVDSAKETLKARIKETLDAYEVVVDVSDLGLVYGNEADIILIREALGEVANSDYRYFYVTGGFTYWRMGTTITQMDITYQPDVVNEDSSINVDAIKEKLAILEACIDYALSFVSDEMSDLEKALVLHDFLVNVCDYDYENYFAGTIPNESYSLWGVLVNEKAVCQGYAEAYAALLNEAGIDSVLTTSNSMNHAWNFVYLDGYWYHVDVTWDDPGFTAGYTYRSKPNNDYVDMGFVYHRYFLKSDDEFLNLSHYGWVEIVEATNSNAYDSYAFAVSNECKNFMYYNSDWYYVGVGSKPKLYKVNLDNSASEYVDLTGSAYYAGEIDDVVYYAGTDAIYSYDLTSGVNEQVVDILAEYPGYVLTEFITRYDSLRAVLYNESTGDFQEISIPVEAKEETVAVTGVVLNTNAITLPTLGQTYQLTATVSPLNATNKNVTWTSSKPEVATVDSNGLVTSVAEGTTTITATTVDGGFTATCEIEVSVVVAATGIAIDRESLTFTSTLPICLFATFTPADADDNVIWTSSNEAVATVDYRGLVTPVANGTCTITATGEYSGVKDTCAVTVDLPVAATGVKLNYTTLSLKDDPVQLVATVLPENADNKAVSWRTSNSFVAKVDENGVVTPIYDGTCTITATTSDGGYTADCEVTVVCTKWVEAVELDKTNLTLNKENETYQLIATVLPENADNKNVTWTSSNSLVATVSQTGLVTAVGNGTATITVTTADGNYKATCEVTVEIPAPPVEPDEPVVTDPVEDFVERMYTVALNRPSDAEGKANWVGMLRANTHDGAGLAEEFILGAEFAMRGLSDEEYVDVLYHTFFNRDADEGGKALWLAVLASGQTRAYVLSNFVNLPEFTMLCESYGIERGVMLDNGDAVNPGIPQFVKRMYTIVLGRDAENEGLYNNVLALVVGALNAESVAKNFFTSEEYLAKNKDTASYVTDLYAVFMNREADATGLKFWTDTIAIGMTRDDVLSEFAKSDEFKAIAASYGLN